MNYAGKTVFTCYIQYAPIRPIQTKKKALEILTKWKYNQTYNNTYIELYDGHFLWTLKRQHPLKNTHNIHARCINTCSNKSECHTWLKNVCKSKNKNQNKKNPSADLIDMMHIIINYKHLTTVWFNQSDIIVHKGAKHHRGRSSPYGVWLSHQREMRLGLRRLLSY